MSFWKTFGFATVSQIDRLLDRQDEDGGEPVTLEELMDEDEMLQELKAQNKKLVDYLADPEILEKVVEYVCTPAADDADDRLKYKFPFLCCEVLCSEVWSISAVIWDNKQLLDRLFEFLDKPSPLPPLLAAYGSRIIAALYQKKVPETLEYMKNKPNFLQSLINHLPSTPVAELLSKFTHGEEGEESQTVVDWLQQNNVIGLLIDSLNSDNTLLHENASVVLLDIVVTASQMPEEVPKPLLQVINTEENVGRLINNAVDKGASSTLLYSLPVVVELVRLSQVQNGLNDTCTQEDLPHAIGATCKRMSDLVRILAIGDDEETVATPAGTLQPFGQSRMRVLELLEALATAKYSVVFRLMMEANLFATLLELFFTFKWNNMLHHAVATMLQVILQINDDSLKEKLFDEPTRLHERLGEFGQAPQVGDHPNNRFGYMGYVTQLATTIEQEAEMNAQIKAKLEASDVWRKYVTDEFEPQRKLEKGDGKPLAVSSDSSDEGGSGIADASMAQSLVHGFPNDFPEDFGAVDFDDDDCDVIFDEREYILPPFNTDEEGFGNEFDSDDDDDDEEENDK